jgi:arabinogalactan oligomer/maltooligosaccharide transport system permease protein
MRLTPRSGSTVGLIAKLILLGLAVAIAIWGAIPLINAQNWIALAILILATVAMLYIYLTPKVIPAKYLFFGTIFLLALQVTPVLYTVSTAFTNFGDGHRGTKQDAIVAIESASVTQAPGSED